jgi:hypothetical protein
VLLLAQDAWFLLEVLRGAFWLSRLSIKKIIIEMPVIKMGKIVKRRNNIGEHKGGSPENSWLE